MEELASIWGYQESIDELKQKLLYTTFELESVREQANEEMRKNKERVNQLLQHLKTACKERDEARDQIQKLLNKFATFNPQNGIINSPIQIQPSKANSSITELDSLSDTYNYQSPNDSFFDIVSAPNSSNLGCVDPQQQHPFVADQGCLAIDALAKGKPLPQKGKLLQAVLEPGPLLKTLFVAGPLPRWCNPPPVQGFQIPPVSIKGCNSEIVMPSLNLEQVNNNKSSKAFSFSEMGCGTSQMFSSRSLMSFNDGPCFGGVNANDYGSLGKRQRLY